TTYGSPIHRDNVPDQDALLVERLRAAGAITFGKTNTPEFGAGSQTFNEVFGRTLNPYDPSKTCGGSSGGAAVALACGMVPIADGSDTGGALRNPAAVRDVDSLRTSPGPVPGWPRAPAPTARAVGTAPLWPRPSAGPARAPPIAAAEAGERFRQPLDRNFRGAGVAWSRALSGLPFDSRVTAGREPQRKTFETLGCVVEEA